VDSIANPDDIPGQGFGVLIVEIKFLLQSGVHCSGQSPCTLIKMAALQAQKAFSAAAGRSSVRAAPSRGALVCRAAADRKLWAPTVEAPAYLNGELAGDYGEQRPRMPLGVTRVFGSYWQPHLDRISHRTIKPVQASTPWDWALTQWH
jgi:hypothetical protein